jgi:hypothetical protein
MNSKDLTGFKNWFASYAASYTTQDPVYDQPIRLKQEHTLRVCKEIVDLGIALGRRPQDRLLAETMALFHDIGRFEQYATYGTFKDAVSENHAALGLRVLAEQKVLGVCSKNEQFLITRAIANHNVRALPQDEKGRVLFFSRLLRDADKLDVWKVFVDHYGRRNKVSNSTITWGLPDTGICSPKILDALRQGKMADTADMVSLNDFKLLQMSWVFDLNFEPTFQAVRQRRYVERIASSLSQIPEVREVVGVLQACLEKHAHTIMEGKDDDP